MRTLVASDPFEILLVVAALQRQCGARRGRDAWNHSWRRRGRRRLHAKIKRRVAIGLATKG